DRISRAVTALIGSAGCGIGLLEPGASRLVHAAAHGFKSEEWRGLALPVGEGIIGQCAQTGVAIRVDDVRTDPRSARRDVAEGEGITGRAVRDLRVRQSADVLNDPRVKYRNLPQASGLRALMAAPLRLGDRAIGAILVFHREVHQFTAAEEDLLLAVADQAA